MRVRLNQRDLDRFMAKVNKTETCWLWTASRNESGYGVFALNGYMENVHRLSYMIHTGEIPKRIFVLHKCDVRHCVNPEHLFLGTNADNVADMISKGRQALNHKYVCLNGHDTSYSSARNSSRSCKQCLREKYAADKLNNKNTL